MKIAIIGGGAAGFFAAISAKTHHPAAQVSLFEQSNKLLSKVKVSGGGRCNVTNGCTSIAELSKAYPRGGKKLKKLFPIFSTQDTRAWFESRAVHLKEEPDGRVFPVSDDSQSIIDCLMREVRKLGIQIELGCGVEKIEPKAERLMLHFRKGREANSFDRVIVATGGSPKKEGLHWLETLGHQIEKPVPSLFTFNMPKEPIRELMGVVAEEASVRIQGQKLKTTGPLLITHWGMSGPAILKLSAFGARILNQLNYQFKAQVNWVNIQNNELVANHLQATSSANSKKQLINHCPYPLPKRLWHFLLHKSQIPSRKTWGEIGKSGINKLNSLLTNDIYEVRGKTTFKEEFVTCGGLSLSSININTMESRVCPNLYFAGEVLDIDGITGGYNFQAAWTTGFVAGKGK